MRELAHHFDTPEQQFESSKLGMWIFLATEILLFGGLFCAYAVYRANHPEVFLWAHHLLDKNLGAINTVVLLCSSFTMAWAVRCAQLGRRRGLIVLLALTLAGGFGFMGIKYVEYESKWKHGLLWGKSYQPDTDYLNEHFGGPHDDAENATGEDSPAVAVTVSSGANGDGSGVAVVGTELAGREEVISIPRSLVPPSPRGPAGTVEAVARQDDLTVAGAPANVHLFFGIYFLMTGLHGLHVLAGMIVIGMLILKAYLGHFSAAYFTPVDLGGLYWHLVDLIWIFLFPLLYLIH